MDRAVVMCGVVPVVVRAAGRSGRESVPPSSGHDVVIAAVVPNLYHSL